MAYVVTKLVTTEESIDFSLLGAFSDMKQAAAAATDVYKDYNKKASFVNLEMVNEWLGTRGEYSFRQDKRNRIQLDISETNDDTLIPAEHQRIYSCHEEAETANLELSQSMVKDGINKAEN